MPDIWGLAAIVVKFGLYVGLLTSIGTVFVALVFKVTGFRRGALAFGLLGLGCAVASFALNGAALTGDASGLTDPEMLGLLWSTQVGTVLTTRMAGLGLLIVGLAFGRIGLWISGIGGMHALSSFALIGHVPDREVFGLTILLLYHLGAIALWIGILTPLKRLAPSNPQQAAALGDRFGRAASVFVPLLVLAGVVMGYILIGSAGALVFTGYGRALLIKGLVVGALLGLAAANKLRFVPRLKAGDVSAADRLSRSISLEWGVVLAILAVTAIITTVLAPPA